MRFFADLPNINARQIYLLYSTFECTWAQACLIHTAGLLFGTFLYMFLLFPAVYSDEGSLDFMAPGAVSQLMSLLESQVSTALDEHLEWVSGWNTSNGQILYNVV